MSIAFRFVSSSRWIMLLASSAPELRQKPLRPRTYYFPQALFFRVLFLLYACPAAKETQNVFPNVADMRDELRAGDYRLVRPSPTTKTAEVQKRYRMDGTVAAFVKKVMGRVNEAKETLRRKELLPAMKDDLQEEIKVTDQELQDNQQTLEEYQEEWRQSIYRQYNATLKQHFPEPRQLDLEVIHLLTTNSPENRRALEPLLGYVAHGLTSFGNFTKHSETIATAAEAVWILSFNDKKNQEILTFEYNAIEKLAAVLDNYFTYYDTTRDEQDTAMANRKEMKPPQINVEAAKFAPIAAMWAAAALQNLAASYCSSSSSSRCEWAWDTKSSLLQNTTAVVIDNAFNREDIMAVLVESEGHLWEKIAGRMLCQNSNSRKFRDSLKPATVEDVRQLAVSKKEKAMLQDPRYMNQLAVWAFAGLLKNLAIRTESHRFYGEGAWKCLCDLTTSADWLESSKAEKAILHLGGNETDCQKRMKTMRQREL
ncbi:unnamed protein product [Amoebophrya sp. A120]|nr:unnamed protein product [Amoebophrya sp. A120]|eukprot:GSA120T00008262001.1